MKGKRRLITSGLSLVLIVGCSAAPELAATQTSMTHSTPTAAPPTPSSTPSETPSPMPSESPTPTTEPSPSLPIVDGLAPDQVQALQDWLDKRTSIGPRFDGLPFGLVPNVQYQDNHTHLYTGQILAARALPDGRALIYIGFEDAVGHRYFVPFEGAHEGVLVETKTTLSTDPENNPERIIDNPEFLASFAEVFENRIALFSVRDRYPNYKPWTQFYKLAKAAQTSDIYSLPDLPEWVNSMTSTEGPATDAALQVYLP